MTPSPGLAAAVATGSPSSLLVALDALEPQRHHLVFPVMGRTSERVRNPRHSNPDENASGLDWFRTTEENQQLGSTVIVQLDPSGKDA